MKKLFLLYEEIHGTNCIPNNFGMTKEEHTVHRVGNQIKNGFSTTRENFIEEYETHGEEFSGSIPLSMATFEADTEMYLKEGLVIYPFIFSQGYNAYYHLSSIGMSSWINFLPEKIKKWCYEDKIKILLHFPLEEITFINISALYKALDTIKFRKQNVLVSSPWKTPDNILSRSDLQIPKKNIICSFHQEITTIVILQRLKGFYSERRERPETPTKKYISLCRRYIPNRIKVHTYLIENDLLQYGYNSMPSESTINEVSLSAFTEQVKKNNYKNINLDLCKEYWRKNGEGITLDSRPLKETERLGGPEAQVWGFNNRNSLKDEYLNSYLSIIVEEDPYQFPYFFILSEKTFRPIFYKHLFILIGNQFLLRSLREKGYQTFDSLWDESYDEIFDEEERVEAALKQAKDLILSPDLPELYNKAKSILEHNYNILTTRSKPGVLRNEILRKCHD